MTDPRPPAPSSAAPCTPSAPCAPKRLSLLDRGSRTATVVCDTDCELLVIDARHLFAVIDEVPAMAHKLLAALATRIRDLDRAHYG